MLKELLSLGGKEKATTRNKKITKWKSSPVNARMGFPCGSDGKASAYNVGDLGSVPGSGRSPGEGNDNPLQYACLKNPMDRGAW